jgi:hypothetical protein
MWRIMFELLTSCLSFVGLQYISTERYFEISFGMGLTKTLKIGRCFPYKIEYSDFCKPSKSMRARL